MVLQRSEYGSCSFHIFVVVCRSLTNSTTFSHLETHQRFPHCCFSFTWSSLSVFLFFFSPFSSVTQQGYQSDNNYLNGATTDFHKDAVDLNAKRGRLQAYEQSTRTSKKVAWPDYAAGPITQFDPERCSLEAAMCCYTSAPSTNSQVCSHDVHDSKEASRIDHGFAVFNGAPQMAHCVGFSWAGNDVNGDFKGNLLAEISFGNLMEMDGGVPGAPRCGCVEAMPTVTSAACQQVSVTGHSFSVVADSTLGFMVVYNDNMSISYQDCGSDLVASYQGTPEQLATLQKKIVGGSDCDAPAQNYLNKQFYVPGTNAIWNDWDSTQWKKTMGQGVNYVPTKTFDVEVRNAQFMDHFNESPNKIVCRVCPQCLPTHKTICYKRLTNVPGNINLMNLLMNSFVGTAGNVHNVDFALYSSYADALSDTARWEACEFDPNHGFPGDCGPVETEHCQWNSHTEPGCTHRDYNTFSHAFYVEKP